MKKVAFLVILFHAILHGTVLFLQNFEKNAKSCMRVRIVSKSLLFVDFFTFLLKFVSPVLRKQRFFYIDSLWTHPLSNGVLRISSSFKEKVVKNLEIEQKSENPIRILNFDGFRHFVCSEESIFKGWINHRIQFHTVERAWNNKIVWFVLVKKTNSPLQ